MGRGMTHCFMMKQVGRQRDKDCKQMLVGGCCQDACNFKFASSFYAYVPILVLAGNEADEDKMEQFLGVAMESRNDGFAVW